MRLSCTFPMEVKCKRIPSLIPGGSRLTPPRRQRSRTSWLHWAPDLVTTDFRRTGRSPAAANDVDRAIDCRRLAVAVFPSRYFGLRRVAYDCPGVVAETHWGC
jgi:hypothetical protein